MWGEVVKIGLADLETVGSIYPYRFSGARCKQLVVSVYPPMIPAVLELKLG